MKAVFDSNILIDYLNGHLSASAELERYQFKLISIISWIEVLVGVPEKHQEMVKAFLNQFEIIGIDKNISTKAIEIRKSHKLKLPDALILATANVHSAILVTRNTKDFDPTSPFIHEPYQILKE